MKDAIGDALPPREGLAHRRHPPRAAQRPREPARLEPPQPEGPPRGRRRQSASPSATTQAYLAQVGPAARRLLPPAASHERRARRCRTRRSRSASRTSSGPSSAASTSSAGDRLLLLSPDLAEALRRRCPARRLWPAPARRRCRRSTARHAASRTAPRSLSRRRMTARPLHEASSASRPPATRPRIGVVEDGRAHALQRRRLAGRDAREYGGVVPELASRAARRGDHPGAGRGARAAPAARWASSTPSPSPTGRGWPARCSSAQLRQGAGLRARHCRSSRSTTSKATSTPPGSTATSRPELPGARPHRLRRPQRRRADGGPRPLPPPRPDR